MHSVPQLEPPTLTPVSTDATIGVLLAGAAVNDPGTCAVPKARRLFGGFRIWQFGSHPLICVKMGAWIDSYLGFVGRDGAGTALASGRRLDEW